MLVARRPDERLPHPGAGPPHDPVPMSSRPTHQRARHGLTGRSAGLALAALMVLVGAGCGRITDPEGAPAVLVLAETVRIERTESTVGFAIETLVRNDGPETIYRIPCGLMIERRQGAGWTSAYEEACLADQVGSGTLPEPIAIAPGQQRLEIIELRATPGAEPPLLRAPALPAELRLVLPLAYTAGDLESPGRVVGRQARTSNSFALVP